MRHPALALVLATPLACFSACGTPDGQDAATRAPTGGVAVVDLDEVAERLGRLQQITDSVQSRQDDANQQLAQLQARLRTQLDAKTRAYGDEPTREETEELRALEEQLTAHLNRNRDKAIEELNRYKQGLIDRFREEVKPVAQRIATGQGFSIVVPKDENLFLTYDPGVEITEQVIEQMLAAEEDAPRVSAEELSQR